jgi:hypothetical protein
MNIHYTLEFYIRIAYLFYFDRLLCYSDLIRQFGQINRSQPENVLLNEVNQLVVQALVDGLVQLTVENYQSLVSLCQHNFSVFFFIIRNMPECKCLMCIATFKFG